MNKQKSIAVALSVSLLLGASLCGCAGQRGGAPADSLGGSEAESTISTYNEDLFLTQTEKEAWRIPLRRFIAENPLEFPDPLHNFVSVGLMDLNFDGTPEVIVRMEGLTSTNVQYQVYDLMSGECISGWDYTLPPEGESAMTVFRDTKNGQFCTIAFSNYHAGWMESATSIDSIVPVDGKSYGMNSLLSERLTFKLGESDGEAAVLDEVIRTVGSDTVDEKTYQDALSAFERTMERIPETAIQFTTVRTDVERDADGIVDVLLTSGQAFVRAAK